MTRPHRRARGWGLGALLPLAIAALSAALLWGAFAEAPARGRRSLAAWALLVGAGLWMALRHARFKLRTRGAPAPAAWSLQASALLAVGVFALSQLAGGLASPLYPLVYVLAAGYVLSLPLRLALPALGFLLGLDVGLFVAARALPAAWPLFAAHAGFMALFASLYHALLGVRLRAAARAEAEAVRRRIAEAEERARELRLVATADGRSAADRQLLASVSELEGSLRDALAVAEAALQPHTVAVFLLSPDRESLRLRECFSRSDRLVRGPLPAREGALGAVLAAERPVRLQGDGPALAYYQGPAPVSSFCGVLLRERGAGRSSPAGGASGALCGALIADREREFSAAEERVLAALAGAVMRAVESERLLGAVRREKEEKARFFRALEELNRTSTVARAAEAAVTQARSMCPTLDLCAVTLLDEPASGRARPRHRVLAVGGDGASALLGLSFADNQGLVAHVVRLGAPLPGRDVQAMEKLVIFDAATSVRGLAALKIFPLRAGDTTVGALVCGSRSAGGLGEGAQAELGMLALQAAEALVRTRLYERAERLATTDGLTGLLNRRTLNAQLAARLREAQRYRRAVSFLLLDIDHFKKVNDTHGHPAGDAVLRGVAALAARQARETDLAARYGGEEIALVLPETDAAGAAAIAERLRAAVAAAPHPTEQGVVRCTISVGVATWPGDGDTPERLLESADRALYRAKQAGRNRVETAGGKAAA